MSTYTLEVLRGRIENLTVVAESMASTEAADAVQAFTCSVGGDRVNGHFSAVGFSNGDEVEVVGARLPDRSLFAHAVRRPGDRKLWMYPHCSRGRKAHWRYARKMALTITIVFYLFVACFSMAANGTDSFWFFFWLDLIAAILTGVSFSLLGALRFRSSVAMAERIFAALGYADPENVDMEKQNSRYWRENDEIPEGNPWVFRYMEDR